MTLSDRCQPQSPIKKKKKGKCWAMIRLSFAGSVKNQGIDVFRFCPWPDERPEAFSKWGRENCCQKSKYSPGCCDSVWNSLISNPFRCKR